MVHPVSDVLEGSYLRKKNGVRARGVRATLTLTPLALSHFALWGLTRNGPSGIGRFGGLVPEKKTKNGVRARGVRATLTLTPLALSHFALSLSI